MRACITNPQITERQRQVQNTTDHFTNKRDLRMQQTSLTDCCDILEVSCDDGVKITSC